jgi:hypothetical protein
MVCVVSVSIPRRTALGIVSVVNVEARKKRAGASSGVWMLASPAPVPPFSAPVRSSRWADWSRK